MLAYYLNSTPHGTDPDLSPYGLKAAREVMSFHKSFREYAATPLRELPELAAECGVGGICVKDESFRFGLNAFKVLGGSYAVARLLEEDPSAEVFITATDGNHGRGVAWAAAHFGRKSVVYMPKGTARERLDNILVLGSDASITDFVYDDAVRKAARDAAENGWTLVQDTASPGYERVPRLIMQGYTTMALEAVQQLGGTVPTHMFLQAGVGSMAAAVAAFLADYYGASCPKIIIVEPDTADCFYLTATAGDGALHSVSGEMDTMMAGLACGEPNPMAWDILGSLASCFIKIPDSAAADGMRALARSGIVSGESGAAGLGAALLCLRSPDLADLREKLGIDGSSVILCFSTEGATDRENYARITGVTP